MRKFGGFKIVARKNNGSDCILRNYPHIDWIDFSHAQDVVNILLGILKEMGEVDEYLEVEIIGKDRL
jgi:hypothetical protein